MNTGEQVQEIFVEDIIPNRFQPRLTFDEKALQELSDSIKEHGVIQPLVLRRTGNKYEIIAGERRYKASCMAGLKKVPAIVREMTDNESAEVALIENVQRKNLTSIEEAQSYRNLLDRGYLTQGELAQKIGVSQPTIANKMRLLNLCDEVQNALLNEQISERHARSLLQLSDPDAQKAMLNKIIRERLTVKQLDDVIKKLLQADTDGVSGSTSGKSDNKNAESVANGMFIQNQENDGNNNNLGFEPSNKNIFGFNVETPTDLETSAPNLNTSVDDTIPPISFNPFQSNIQSDNDISSASPFNSSEIGGQLNASPEEPEAESTPIETFDMFGDIVSSDPVENESELPIEPVKSIGDQINSIRDTVRGVEQSGFMVEMEEYDFEDVYQMVVKIKKDHK